MFEFIKTHYVEVFAVLLFGIGLFMLIFHKNLIKKIMGLNIMDTGTYLFLASMGYITGKLSPIYKGEGIDNIVASNYVNPIPAGLVLTGIVVSVSVTAISLSLTIRMYSRYHTLNVDEVYKIINKRYKEEDK